MEALSNEATLSTLSVGRVVESTDIRRQAFQNREFVLQQAKRNVSFASVSQQVYDKASQANLQLNKFDVEDIYERSPVGDKNANVWFNAKRIDRQAIDQIETVRYSCVVPWTASDDWSDDWPVTVGALLSYQGRLPQERSEGWQSSGDVPEEAGGHSRAGRLNCQGRFVGEVEIYISYHTKSTCDFLIYYSHMRRTCDRYCQLRCRECRTGRVLHGFPIHALTLLR